MPADGTGERRARGDLFFPWLAAYLVLLSAVQVGVLGSSLASVPLSRPLAIGILIGALLAARRVHRQRSEGAAVAAPWAGLSGGRWTRPLAGGFVALFLLLLACAVCITDLSWDGNSYHLPTIQQWFQQGQVDWIEGPAPGLRFMNGYPKAGEVTSLFLCTLVHPALSNTLNLVYLPLGVLGIASIARSFGASRAAALGAGAALLLVPINVGQSLTTYVDSAFGSAAIAWLAVLVHSRRPDGTRPGLQALILGCAMGQLIGTKGTGLAFGAIGAAVLGCVQVWGRPPALPARRLAAWWLAVVVGAFAVGGFWYARNIAHGESPLFPMGLSVGGVALLPGDDPYNLASAFVTDGFIGPLPAPVRLGFTWLQGLWHWPRSIIGFDMRLGGLGFLWPLGCLPAVWALARRRLRVRAPWREELANQPLWLVLAIVTLGIAFLPCTWWSRFTIWVYGLGLPCMAVMAGLWTGRIGRAWLVSCAAIAWMEAGVVVARWQVPLLGIAIRDEHGGPPKPAPAVKVPSHFYPPWVLRGTVVERIARGPDTVGIGPLGWHQEPIIGVLSGPVGARRVHFVPRESDIEAWYAETRPRYVVMDERLEVPAAMARLQPQVHSVRSLRVLQFW